MSHVEMLKTRKWKDPGGGGVGLGPGCLIVQVDRLAGVEQSERKR